MKLCAAVHEWLPVRCSATLKCTQEYDDGDGELHKINFSLLLLLLLFLELLSYWETNVVALELG